MFAAGNLKRDASTGHLKYNASTGHLAYCPPLVCTRCPDSTPSAYSVTISGTTVCTSCINFNTFFPDSSWLTTAGTLDGTYILSQSPPLIGGAGNACLWGYEETPLTWSVRHYTGSIDCTTDTEATNPYACPGSTQPLMAIYMSKGVSAFGLFAEFGCTNSGAPTYPIWQTTATASATCATTIVFNALYSACDDSGANNLAYGGTATAVAL